jgi:MFS family permease
MLVFGPLSGIVGTRLGNKVPLAAGGFLTALGLALLAVAHESQLEIILFSLVMSAGIGLAFAAMPNLIIEAVPAQQTGEATGFNALVRSVGSSLGSQVSATILAPARSRASRPTLATRVLSRSRLWSPLAPAWPRSSFLVRRATSMHRR